MPTTDEYRLIETDLYERKQIYIDRQLNIDEYKFI